MKLSDFVADFLAKQGIKHVFGLTGGAVVHLFDSVDRHPGLQPIFNHHEQAGAFAAEAYAKINGMGACFTTTGPGVTNAITGLAAAWLDSVPCIFISGQARLEHTTQGKPIRQLGTQQLDVMPLVKSLTKYSVMLEDPKAIKYQLQKAAFLARSGRPGPVWIDIPLNFQWTDVDPDRIPSFDENEIAKPDLSTSAENLKTCLTWLEGAKRPLVLIGYGVRVARAQKELKTFLEKYHLPYIATWGGADLLSQDEGMNLGRPGIAGQRGANLAVQNCDLLLCIGSHLNIPLTGTLYEAFAREAKVVMVDIDQDELDFKTVHVELPIRMDAKDFLAQAAAQNVPLASFETGKTNWLEKCSEYRQLNQVPAEWSAQKEKVNQYVFIDRLSDRLEKNEAVVVDGGGTNVYISYQAFKIKEGQRMILSTGLCSMGSGLPEAIGACFANDKKRTICLCGDGSLQLNIQELQTIVHHRLPIKIFVFNNDGYNSIRQTQKGFLDKNYCGSDAKGGMSLPDFLKVAEAYGLKVFRMENHQEMNARLDAVLAADGPTLCEVMVPYDFDVVPTQGFAKNADGTFRPQPLEDMAPLLDRDKFNKLMVVKPWDK